MFRPQVYGLRLKGFRKIQAPLELRFTTPSGAPARDVVFAGPNGSGKTSILEAILLGLGLDGLITRDMPKAERTRQAWRTQVQPGGLIEVEVSLGAEAPVWLERSPQGLLIRHADGKRAAFINDWREWEVEYFSSWRAPALVGPVKPAESGRRPNNNETNRLWRLKQKIADERARTAYGQPSSYQEWMQRLNEAWAHFHGHDGTRLEDQPVEEAAESQNLMIDLFVVKNGKRLCSVDQVSAGEIELLSYAGWLVTKPLETGLLLMDEPELHLHPEWQAALLPALHRLAPQAQFIVASHANAPWDQAYGFARFLLVDDGDPRSQTWRQAHQIKPTISDGEE